jgi:hypothetical protein
MRKRCRKDRRTSLTRKRRVRYNAMKQLEHTLTLKNADRILRKYVGSIEKIGKSIKGKAGLELLRALKREQLNFGPYPTVTLFEAANRIMTDLVILQGTVWLLKEKAFPFSSYTVEYGNEDKNGFDIRATAKGRTLVGEAFNVAPSFFHIKKSSMLKKLRNNGRNADYRIIMVNDDAIDSGYSPKREAGLYYVIVNIASGEVLIK